MAICTSYDAFRNLFLDFYHGKCFFDYGYRCHFVFLMVKIEHYRIFFTTIYTRV